MIEVIGTIIIGVVLGAIVFSVAVFAPEKTVFVPKDSE